MTEIPEEALSAVRSVPAGPHIVTIGNFDGVHRGHRYLLDIVIDRAANRAARSLVVTFEPHPITVVAPNRPYFRLSTPDDKVDYLQEAGIQDVAVVPFSHEFAALEPDEFLDLLLQEVEPIEIVVGDEFRFGRGRSGDVTFLKTYGERTGLDIKIVDRLTEDERVLSSSLIRTALAEGNIRDATQILGRPYSLEGDVVRGEGRGRKLGFPTANLDIPEDMLVPASGIYAVFVNGVDGDQLPGMAYIGTSSTFGHRERTVEVNIFDFEGDLYSMSLEVEFVARTREDIWFASVEELIEQMRRDESEIRNILKQLRAGMNGVKAE